MILLLLIPGYYKLPVPATDYRFHHKLPVTSEFPTTSINFCPHTLFASLANQRKSSHNPMSTCSFPIGLDAGQKRGHDSSKDRPRFQWPAFRIAMCNNMAFQDVPLSLLAVNSRKTSCISHSGGVCVNLDWHANRMCEFT